MLASWYSRVALQRTLRGVGKKCVVTIVRCIRIEYFPLREIGTQNDVRYNSGHVVNVFTVITTGEKTVGTKYVVSGSRVFHYAKSGPRKKYVITVDTL